MKVALVHDFLGENNGGAEKVLGVMHEIWKEAPIYTLFFDKKYFPQFENAKVVESFLAKLPLARSKYRWYLPLMPIATEKFDLQEFDVVVSSVSAYAKGVKTKKGTKHISYCHTPTRYLWIDKDEYVKDLRVPFLVKIFIPYILEALRKWDKKSVDRVSEFVANSRTVQDRIKKYYDRDSIVIYPPVETEKFYISPDIQDYFVTGGRLVPSKRFDLVIDVFNRLKIPLKIFGSGPELNHLKKIAHSNIQFLGKISEDEKAKVLSQAKAFIHPQVEDFGITPVESMASGRPVIAYGVGGATETVIPGKTGILFYEQNWESILDAVINFNNSDWNSEEIRKWAQKFDVQIFKDELKNFVHKICESA